MNTIIETMISAYKTETIYDKKNAMKEVLQEIILCGLSRAGFFQRAAFYGGTALRMFYGLDRFSEDLDFSLEEPDDTFDIKKYFPELEKEIAAYGLHADIREKKKSGDSNIKSAFVKGNTVEHLLMFYPDESSDFGINKNELTKIKLEVDTNPPKYAAFERRYRLRPMPYEVNLYDEPSLFAGKIHAVIGRSWSNRIKGRDLYDYVFYIAGNVPVNRMHLKDRLVQSGHLEENDPFELEDLKAMLCSKFDSIDYSQAKEDVIPFLRNPGETDLWSAEFFKQITDSLTER